MTMAVTPSDGPGERLAPPAPDRHGRDTFEPVPPDVAARPTVALPRRRPLPRRRAPVALAAVVTTAWAAIVSYASVIAVVALVAAVSGGASVGAVFRFGTGAWLLGHGVPLSTGAGPVTLVPLALPMLAAWRVARAGVHTTRAIGGRRTGAFRLVGVAAVGVALVYGLLGAAAAAGINGPGLSTSPLRAGLTLGVFGLLAAAWGGLAESGLLAAAARRMPALARDALRTGVVATLLVLGAGAAVGGVAIAIAGGDASGMVSAYHAGVAGQAGLTLLCLMYAPNLAVWAAAYLVGPGFAVGVGTTVSAAKVTLGALPAVPVLAGLPSSAVSGVGGLLLGVPVAAGMTAGWLLVRRLLRQAGAGAPPPNWSHALAAAAAAGPVAGVLLGLSAWASGGSLGSGRLVVTGPTGWLVGLVGTGVVALGAVIAALASLVILAGHARHDRRG
jgi:hypothetical protein